MRTDLGFCAAACQEGTGRTHRLKRRRRGRAQRGSMCGSRPLTPAVPERLRGRLWPVATKRIEYGTRAQEGKDTAARWRMFIGHEPATGSRAAYREGEAVTSQPSRCLRQPEGSLPGVVVCYDCRVFFIVPVCLKSAHGHQCQHSRPPAPDRAARSGRRSAQRRPGQSSVGGQPPLAAAVEGRGRATARRALQVARWHVVSVRYFRWAGRCHRTWRSGPGAMDQGWRRGAG